MAGVAPHNGQGAARFDEVVAFNACAVAAREAGFRLLLPRATQVFATQLHLDRRGLAETSNFSSGQQESEAARPSAPQPVPLESG